MIWKPSTVCSDIPCVLEFNGENESINLTKIIFKCKIHENIDDSILVDEILEEVRRVEILKLVIFNNGGKYVLTPADKNLIGIVNSMSGDPNAVIPDEIWGPGKFPSFTFDATRDLEVDTAKMDPNDKANLIANLETELAKIPIKIKESKIRFK